MGVFSSEYVTTVGTVVSRVVTDTLIPDSVESGLFNALLKNEDINDSIREGLFTSIGVRAGSMYRYAKDHYVHGLPSGQAKEATQGKVEVLALLNDLEGAAVTLNYCRIAPPNDIHIAWSRLISNHGYNQTTNQLAVLSATKGSPVYLKDMHVVIPTSSVGVRLPASTDDWGISAKAGYTPTRAAKAPEFYFLLPNNPVLTDANALDSYVRIDYTWKTEVGEFNESFNLDTGGYDDLADYYHASYVVGGIRKYWIYKAGSGTYQDLDLVFNNGPTLNGSYFPFTYFRFNKVSEATDKTTQSYITSKKMVKYLGMDFDSIATSIDENPDIASVEQAMMMFAVPANSTNQLELSYLYKFFENLYYTGSTRYISEAQANQAKISFDTPELMQRTLLIQDQRFKMALSNGGIYRRSVNGSIGAVGHYTFQYASVFDRDFITVTVGESDSITTVTPYYVGHFTYCKQVSANRYEEIKVVDLKQFYFVLDNYYSIADEQDPILLIPLDYSITSTYAIPEAEVLYSRALHFVFNASQTQEIKWYQSSFFQFVLFAVAVVATVASLGADGGAFITAVLALDVAAITSTGLILLGKILLSLAIGAALKVVVKVIGLEAALIIALVAAAAGYYQVLESGSLAGAPWAGRLLMLSSGLSSAANQVLGDLSNALLAEYESFGLLKTESEKALEEAKKLLEVTHHLDPFVVFGESPDDFYNRTVHSGNVGVLGISAISYYVDIALTLPKISETIGEESNGFI